MSKHVEQDWWTVLLGGAITVTQRLRRQVRTTRVIAADSGIRHAKPLGLMPDLWIGDFDSAGAALEGDYPDVPRETHPPAKNATDGALAVDAALQRGARGVMLVGAFGGRTDQATTHLLLALRLQSCGVSVILSDGAEEGIVLTDTPVRPDWPTGATFSLLAFSDLEGVTIQGARWPLTDATIAMGDTLGLSNEVGVGPAKQEEGLGLPEETDGDLELQLRSGRGLAIARLT